MHLKAIVRLALRAPLLDLLLLLTVCAGTWKLGAFGIPQIGTLSMLATGGVGLLLLYKRGIRLSDVGLVVPRRADIALSLQAAGVIGFAYISTPLLVLLLGPLSQSSAIENQPLSPSGFVVDIIVFTWLGAALGEELVFRGIVLHRLRELFRSTDSGDIAAVGVQAVWFGLGHPSQGHTGIALTALMGFGLGIFFLKRSGGSLVPLILAHGSVNTLVLTANYVATTSQP